MPFPRTVATAALFATALLLPLLALMGQGWTLVGRYEESVGYRYFYSLRILYGGEYVFLPQGQLCDVFYQGLHMLLTMFGLAPTTLLPRADWFAYLAVILGHAVTAAAFAWAVSRLSL